MGNLRLPGLQRPQLRQALEDLELKLRSRWPEATFEAHRGEDPEGIYLDVAVDADFWDVMDEFDELQQQILFERRMPLYVVPLLPPHRLEQQLRERAAAQAGAPPRSASG